MGLLANPQKRLILFLCILLNPVLYAMDWPDPSAALIKNFGLNQDGRPILGHVFNSEGSVRAAESGELLFTCNPDMHASNLAAPMGSWYAVDHGDGLITVYSRLYTENRGLVPVFFEKGAPLASAGNSGWTETQGFMFSIYDRKERCWVNPSMIVNSGPDTRKPLIKSFTLLGRNGNRYNPEKNKSIPQGSYRILVEVEDFLDDSQKISLAPHRILCFINGSEQGALHLETIYARDGVLLVTRNRAAAAAEVYSPDSAYDIGETALVRGRAAIELIASDVSGNERIITYELVVE